MTGSITDDTVLGFVGILLLLFLFFLLIFVIFIAIRLRNLTNQFRRLSEGTSSENLEELLSRLFKKLDGLEQTCRDFDDQLQLVRQATKRHKGGLGIVRYNMFANEGSDLSFSLAIIDQSVNGVVITSLYGRDDSRVYAKPLQNGTSLYALTDEEKNAIDQAKQQLTYL